MNRKTLYLILPLAAVLASALVLAGCAGDAAQEGQAPAVASEADQATEVKELKAQETCPVMGGKIQKDLYEDYEGNRVYFCCEGCEKDFLRKPKHYLAKMKANGEKPEVLSE